MNYAVGIFLFLAVIVVIIYKSVKAKSMNDKKDLKVSAEVAVAILDVETQPEISLEPVKIELAMEPKVSEPVVAPKKKATAKKTAKKKVAKKVKVVEEKPVEVPEPVVPPATKRTRRSTR